MDEDEDLDLLLMRSLLIDVVANCKEDLEFLFGKPVRQTGNGWQLGRTSASHRMCQVKEHKLRLMFEN